MYGTIRPDQAGGHVDTTRHVRAGGDFKNTRHQEQYDNLEDYRAKAKNGEKSSREPVHKDPAFINTGKIYKEASKKGTLKDGYTGEFLQKEEFHREHIVSCKENYEDRTRVMSHTSFEEIANLSQNLTPLEQGLNSSKDAHSVTEYIESGKFDKYADKRGWNEQKRNIIKENMRSKDREARSVINKTIDRNYYTSKDF